mmetsp:Transcript_48680/g.150338  ORF Transcript_48680/g.150338 Transcript_48680/m.150338 type:complete len:222 (+) Transcript_48680:254-919(+)
MPRLPLYRCFGFQSGTWWSASPFLPNFSNFRIFLLRFFSLAWKASSLGSPLSLLLLRARAAESARSTEPSSPPALAARFRLPSSECADFAREADLPRTLEPSRPLSFSSFSTSAAFFLPLRRVGWWFVFLFSCLSSRFWRILLCISSNNSCVSAYLLRTCSSSRNLASSKSNASSFSSSTRRPSMSGSTKSAMFLPSRNSGTTSYFQEVSSRIVFLQRSTE